MARTYTIKYGDTLSQIAQREGTDLKTLQGLNPVITDPNKIYAGAALALPDLPGVQPEKPKEPVYSSDDIRKEEEAKILEQQKKDADLKAEAERLRLQKEIADTKASLEPGEKPAKPDITGEYKTLVGEKDEAGLSYQGVQQSIVDLSKEKEDVMAQLRAFKRTTPEGVAQGFAQGAISKEEQAVQDKLDFINRQINTYSLQLQNRADVINTIMSLKKEDYANASTEYDKEFTKNVQIYSQLIGAKDKQSDNARAALQIVWNNIQGGNVKFGTMSESQKATIKNLEMQAGYPAGFTAFVTANVKGDIVASGSRVDSTGNEYFDILTKNSDGSMSVQSVYRGTGKTSDNVDEEEVIENFEKDLSNYIVQMDEKGLDYDTVARALLVKYGRYGFTAEEIMKALGK